MRVFVTVGNATVGFDRLLRIADEALADVDEEVDGICQHGTGSKGMARLKNVSFLSRRDFEDEMRRADVVICHGGVGTLRSARTLGHRPFVLPRLSQFGEIVNDHQVELLRVLRDEGSVREVTTPGSLAREMASRERSRLPQREASEAIAEVKRAIQGGVSSRHIMGTWVVRLIALGRATGSLMYRDESGR